MNSHLQTNPSVTARHKLKRVLSWPLRILKQRFGWRPNVGQPETGAHQIQLPNGGLSEPPRFPLAAPAAVAAAYDYTLWAKLYDTLTAADRAAILLRIAELADKPLLSILLPVDNGAELWLRRAIESVRQQLYACWELCVAADNATQPHVRRMLEKYARKDSRIKVTYRNTNEQVAAASNSALALAPGRFIALLDTDAALPAHALYLVAAEINAHPAADLIYSDEDKIDDSGARYEPHFKSDWNPDLFYAYDMISRLVVYRTAAVKQSGGLSEGYEGRQDYALALRVIEQIPANHIRHIPRVLYHRRVSAAAGTLAADAQNRQHAATRRALQAHFQRKGVAAAVLAGHDGCYRVRYPVPAPAPLVSLIVATRDRLELLRQTIAGLLDETDYAPLEIIIVDNQSAQPATLQYLREVQTDARVKVIEYDAAFNYAAINNLGVRAARGALLALVNNDIKIIAPDWLSEMVSHAVRPEIGAVGAKLIYPDETIQHAGVILGVNGVAAHAHRLMPRHSPGYHNRAVTSQNLSAVTGACMLLRRAVFAEVGGLDEINLPVAYNDIDLCLRIRAKGYRIVWTPYAELYHHESASRGLDTAPENVPRAEQERDYMMQTWGAALKNDPYYNPNLTTTCEDFSLAVPPRVTKQW